MKKRSNRGGIYYRMARFEQYILHPGRNHHYQTGRQRDPWYRRKRVVMVPVPTKKVNIDVGFDVYDTVKKENMFYIYTHASSFKDIDDFMTENNKDNDRIYHNPKLIHHHLSKRGKIIRHSCNKNDTNARKIWTSSSPYGTASYRHFIANTKVIIDLSGLPF